MLRTYEAILSGDHVDWTKEKPDLERPVRVHITLVEEPHAARERGERMAAALAKLATIEAFSELSDASSWQRQTRADRALPGRIE